MNAEQASIAKVTMEPKRFAALAMIQRVVNLTKRAHDIRLPANMPNSLSENYWRGQSNSTSEQGQTLSVVMSYPKVLTPTTGNLVFNRNLDLSRAKKLLQLELDRGCVKIPKLSRYDPKLCADLVRDLAQQLRRAIKSEFSNLHRYKTLVLVTIAQTLPDRQTHQSMIIASRCLWDPETDGSITVQGTMGYDMIVVATLFAICGD